MFKGVGIKMEQLSSIKKQKKLKMFLSLTFNGCRLNCLQLFKFKIQGKKQFS